MDLEISCDDKEGVIIGIPRGDIDLEFIKSAAIKMWEASPGEDARILWDMRNCRLRVQTPDIRVWAEFAKTKAPHRRARIAFVADEDLEFGLLRMLNAFRDRDDTQIELTICRDIDAAMVWLKR